MASIRQKPSGRWEARYRDARGEMHARSFGGKVAARCWAAEMESDLRRGEWIDPKLARTTFGSWAEEYLTTIVHLRNVTRGDYERALRTHILPAFAERPMAQIEQVDVRKFMAEKQASGLAPKSLQKIRLVFRQVLEPARGSGAIKVNPCDGIVCHGPFKRNRSSSRQRRWRPWPERLVRRSICSCGSRSRPASVRARSVAFASEG